MLILKGNNLQFRTWILIHSFTYQCTPYTTAKISHCIFHKITVYVLNIQSEHKYISNKWHIKYQQYQLHVSASILAIVRLYSTYQLTIQCVRCIL